ncbi:signal peptide peptidase-domain-containing protein [Dipodascopsis tothii]|uniref:signal peptide peptidase-domain-containing protein n=1 Tax=Dipodascopsis tothii TaxID=44089 RepID=UPI0034CF3628
MANTTSRTSSAAALKDYVFDAARTAIGKYTESGQPSIFDAVEKYIDPVYLTYSVLVVSAVAVIYAASYATLYRPSNAQPANPRHELFHPTDLDTISPARRGFILSRERYDKLRACGRYRDAKELIDDVIEGRSGGGDKLAAEDAWLMPVFGGITLVSMYYALKKLSAHYIQLLMNSYFSVLGVFNIASAFAAAYNFYVRATGGKYEVWQLALVEEPVIEGMPYDAREPEEDVDDVDDEAEKDAPEKGWIETIVDGVKGLVSKSPEAAAKELAASSAKVAGYLTPVPGFSYMRYVGTGDVLGLVVGLAVVGANIYTGHWTLGNILGSSFAYGSIQLLTIDSFKTGYILLGGLFFYDIFFVFGTDIMVTVATTLTVPIKLTAPRPPTVSSPEGSLAMLGLGDIVVPALFLSLCLRFDLHNFHRLNTGTEYYSARRFPKPYFTAGMLAYVLSLVITISVMHFFKTGQPALLYICPLIGGAVFVTAMARKELGELFTYKEDLRQEFHDTITALRKSRRAEKLASVAATSPPVSDKAPAIADDENKENEVRVN